MAAEQQEDSASSAIIVHSPAEPLGSSSGISPKLSHTARENSP